MAAGNSLDAGAPRDDAFEGLREVLGWAGLLYLVLVTACVVYFDDIQIRGRMVQDAPTIYNVRIAGAKIIDLLSVSLLGVTAVYALARGTVRLTPVHRSMLIIFGVYCYAAAVGFIYGFFLSYDYAVWLQDFQQIIYLAGWFLIAFHLIDTKAKWRVFASAFLVLLALKNYLILYDTLTGVGKAIGDWAFRASQNAEFTYFPMLFFPLALLLLRSRAGAPGKLVIAVTAVVYLFNALVGIYRTVWVMLILGTIYLMTHLTARERARIAVAGVAFLALVVLVISLMFPRFVDLAFGYKFLSILDWSIGGDRSNATRMIEVVNVVHRLFANFAIFQGMGLGAWWDDSARRLLQDYGSGFTFKWRFHGTHMWYVTQLLKLGLIGTMLYWFAFVRIFRFNSRSIRAAAGGWEAQVALGLLVGLLCAVVSSAEFVRMFLVIGINIALLTSFSTLFGRDHATGGGEA